MLPSVVSIVVFIFSISFVLVYINIFFRGSPINKVSRWRSAISKGLFVNVVCFYAIAMIFYLSYGFIADDINYYYYPISFNQTNLFKLKTPGEFMWFIVRPLRRIFSFDLPSCHILFGAFGFIGCLNFIKVLSYISDFKSKVLIAHNRLALWVMLCFPNFMAWGRFFGKDSSMFFFASAFTLCAAGILLNKGKIIFNFIGIVIFFYLMERIRPHVAGALAISFAIGYVFKIQQARIKTDTGFGDLMRIFGPAIFIGIAILFGFTAYIKMAGTDEITLETTEQVLISARARGGYGGSAIGIKEDYSENPHLIWKPANIAANVLNLLFAPMPWQIRGAKDIVAIVSNLLLIYLLVKLGKGINYRNYFNLYLATNVFLLCLILSFMAGNVGLILRQKTIILPFIFLFLFSRLGKEPISSRDVHFTSI
jgi:hypothetical protein